MTAPGLPTRLYKYRSMDEGSRRFTRSIVVDHGLYFAAPTDFNDPFDTLPECSVESTPEERLLYYRQNIEEHQAHETPEAREAALVRFLDASDDERLEWARSAMHESAKASAICCFSARNDSVLMWSHYASNHKGICLRFASAPPSSFASAQPVIYQRDRPVLNRIRISLAPGGPDLSAWGRSLLVKADFWAYEQEWRILSTRGACVETFRPHELDGIILGTRISQEAADQVAEWVRERTYAPIEILRAVPARNTFSVEIHSLGWVNQ